MSKESENEKKPSKNLLSDAKFVYNVATDQFSEIVNNTVKKIKSDHVSESASSENVVNSTSMRTILPMFIENEQKNSQPVRLRNIQSSPVRFMRRFSTDSNYLEKPFNVSLLCVHACLHFHFSLDFKTFKLIDIDNSCFFSSKFSIDVYILCILKKILSKQASISVLRNKRTKASLF